MLGQWHAYIVFGHGALTALRILVSHYARGCYSSSLVRREGHGFQFRGGSPSIGSSWATRPDSTSNSSRTQRSGGRKGPRGATGTESPRRGMLKGFLGSPAHPARSASVSPRREIKLVMSTLPSEENPCARAVVDAPGPLPTIVPDKAHTLRGVSVKNDKNPRSPPHLV